MHRLAHAKAAGDVAQHVDAAEARHRGIDCGVDLSLFQEIRRREHALVIFAVVRAFEPGPIAVDQNQVGAAFREGMGHAAAKVAGGAGHHHGCVTHVHVHPPGDSRRRKRGGPRRSAMRAACQHGDANPYDAALIMLRAITTCWIWVVPS